MSVILHKELSYQIVGILYEVFHQLGPDYQEKYYQRAIEALLSKYDISFEREIMIPVMIDTIPIGRHYLDFLIDKVIILELKKGDEIMPAHIRQVLMYLKSTNLQLGILATFGRNGVQYKRIINKDYVVHKIF